MTSKHIASIIFIALAISSCATNSSQTEIVSSTSFTLVPGAHLPQTQAPGSTDVLTATLSPTPVLTDTPLPPPSTPTVTPVEGITSTQVNVRAEPSTASDVLGIILPNTRVEIIGKDPGGSWWQILYPQGTQEKGWVTAQYITTTGTPDVPVIGEGSNPNNGNIAIIQQQLNVRSGPGADFNSLGTLNPQDVVSLIGKDANGVWLQINFTAGPEGKGWISAAFVQAQGVENLPIIAESGAVVGTGTPTAVPFTPTPTLIPAPTDNDSAQSPTVNVTLSGTGSRSFQYSSDVSSPDGDNEDWIQFTPFTRMIRLLLDCTGNGTLTAEVLENDNHVQNLTCAENTVINTVPGRQFIIHIEANPMDELQYTRYTLWVDSIDN